ncbi:MAG: methionyl-tRNA formyltransferase [Cellvibrionaceae bacterium]
MNIGFFGDGEWGVGALRLLVDAGHKIDFVVGRTNGDDTDLKALAHSLDTPFLNFDNVNHDDSVLALAQYGSCLFVSMSFDQIIRPELLGVPPQGFVNCHAGALPFYRGRNPLNWALINDEKRFGITAHYIDEGIDTGAILVQEFFSISDSDDYQSLLAVAIEHCPKVLLKAVDAIASGTQKPIVQAEIHPLGFYCGRRGQGDEIINWQWNSRALFNFIRAITTPGPGAITHLAQGGSLALLSAEEIPQAPNYRATVGEVVGRSKGGVVVKTQDSTLMITRAAWVEKGPMGEPFIPQFPIGTRLTASANPYAVQSTLEVSR